MFKKISLCALAISNLICTTDIYASSGFRIVPAVIDGKTYRVYLNENNEPVSYKLDNSAEAQKEQIYNRLKKAARSISERAGMVGASLTLLSNNKHSLFTLGATSLACSAAYECLNQINFDSKIKDFKMGNFSIGTLMLGAALGGALVSRNSGGIMIASSLGVAGCCLAKTLADKLLKGVPPRTEPSEERGVLSRIAGFAGDMKKNLSSACEMVVKPLAFYAAGKFCRLPSSIVYPATAALIANNVVSSCIKTNSKDSIKESLIKRGVFYVIDSLGWSNTDASSENIPNNILENENEDDNEDDE